MSSARPTMRICADSFFLAPSLVDFALYYGRKKSHPLSSPLSERNAAFQAGFIVLKPDMRVFDQYLDIIREGNYVGGFSRENGWGGLGYGGVVGSMAMQGLPAYFYDVVRPNSTVELNGCRYNHMGADVYYDDVPNFIKKYKDLHGKCRRNTEGCEDCRKTDLDLVKNVHFTNCRKPWNCAGRSSTGKGDIDPRTADYDHCMQVRRLSSRPDPGRWGGGGGEVTLLVGGK